MNDMLAVSKEMAISLYGSQAALARALHVSKQVVSRWPNGAPIPERYALRLRFVLKPEAFCSTADDKTLREALRLARELLDLYP